MSEQPVQRGFGWSPTEGDPQSIHGKAFVHGSWSPGRVRRPCRQGTVGVWPDSLKERQRLIACRNLPVRHFGYGVTASVE